MKTNPDINGDLTDDEIVEYKHIFNRTMAALGRNGQPHETNELAAHDAAGAIIRQYRQAAIDNYNIPAEVSNHE